jgi:meso-butanediol dehydrogenase / (S,S)-butanediol dehydrogenase / diacetyl reductase
MPGAARLEGKVALISGGGTGIGAATARRFAREGARVVVTGRRAQPIEAVAAETGGLAVRGDVRDQRHLAEAVDAAVERFGGLDVVVANAGVAGGGDLASVADRQWGELLEVNLTGVMRLCRVAIPALLERGGGSIVTVSSVAALAAGPEMAAYATGKAALLGLTRSMAVDYGPHGIRVNALCPGWARTEMADAEMDGLAELRGIDREAAYELASRRLPLRRVAGADEIAACCLFLASDEASFVTGAVLVADGGGQVLDAGTLAWAEPPAAGPAVAG